MNSYEEKRKLYDKAINYHAKRDKIVKSIEDKVGKEFSIETRLLIKKRAELNKKREWRNDDCFMPALIFTIVLAVVFIFFGTKYGGSFFSSLFVAGFCGIFLVFIFQKLFYWFFCGGIVLALKVKKISRNEDVKKFDIKAKQLKAEKGVDFYDKEIKRINEELEEISRYEFGEKTSNLVGKLDNFFEIDYSSKKNSGKEYKVENDIVGNTIIADESHNRVTGIDHVDSDGNIHGNDGNVYRPKK